MAVPVAVIAKAAVILTGEKGRKFLKGVLTAVLSPLILILILICCMGSGAAEHNNAIVKLCFNSGSIPSQIPEEYRQHVEAMRESFTKISAAVSGSDAGDGQIDVIHVRAIFYALYFGADTLPGDTGFYMDFVKCFIKYEQRTRTITNEDGSTTEETYTAAIAIHDINEIYRNLESALLITITEEDKTNAQRIYAIVSRGSNPGDSLTPPGSALGDGSYQALIQEAEKYLGYPYVWGGSNPSTSFDCSGFICWVYTQSGVYNLTRTTAQGIFNQCTVVSEADAKPGDLVFFTGTYASGVPVSHIGIYVGNNQMLHCGDPIQYTSIGTSYWQQHFYAFGRLN